MAKRKVFVSYHHGGDQQYYDAFSRIFHDRYDIVYDNSLDRRIDSDDVDYVIRRIRENYIFGSSCTLVLCGVDTPDRKYVDWEIKATLDQQGGLVGIKLPSLVVSENSCRKPARLQDNLNSNYAEWIWWESIIEEPGRLLSAIEAANGKSARLIDNSRVLRTRNG